MLPEVIWSDMQPELSNLSFTVNIKSHGLPLGAGLGSSAAFSVAMVGAIHRMRQYLLQSCTTTVEWGSSSNIIVPVVDQLTVINGWAFAAEVLLHGSPSGLDNTVSCHGGLVRFTRKVVAEGEFENIRDVPKLDILLTNTKVPRSTKALVAGVKALLEANRPVVQPIFDSIEAISLGFLAAIEAFAASSSSLGNSSSNSSDELHAKVVSAHSLVVTILNL